jgi:serine/threonine protein kinase
MLQMERLADQGKFPLRITHNDTKINNILFDGNNRAIAVIDLDTVMPGYLLYDFGDAIRTGTATCDEDEPYLSKAGINLELFSAYTKGFLETTSTIITPAETEYLAFSACVMTFIIGLRFLTDHLDGDRYYKTAYPGHNLHRANVQFGLLRSMELYFKDMQKIIKEIRSDTKPDGVFETRRV